jgi:hypothetical protein
MTVSEELLNKNALAVIKLSRALGRYRSGDKLLRVKNLAKEIQLSVGITHYGTGSGVFRRPSSGILRHI